MGYVAIAFSFVAWFIMFKTKFGLRLRSVGEHPQAADTLGINVYLMRYYGVLISGFLGGVGGALYAQSASVNFSATTIVGPGFIALAAMIFGKWSPIGAMLSSLFFGLSQALAVVSTQIPFLAHIPGVYLRIAPYVLTIIVLAAFFGKSVAPKSRWCELHQIEIKSLYYGERKHESFGLVLFVCLWISLHFGK